MTLATYNRYVDNATGVSKTGCMCGQHGGLVVGNTVLYWQEDIKKVRKPFKAKGKHRAKRHGGFFLGRFRIPRKHFLFYK
jgi:hypothetical protein